MMEPAKPGRGSSASASRAGENRLVAPAGAAGADQSREFIYGVSGEVVKPRTRPAIDRTNQVRPSRRARRKRSLAPFFDPEEQLITEKERQRAAYAVREDRRDWDPAGLLGPGGRAKSAQKQFKVDLSGLLAKTPEAVANVARQMGLPPGSGRPEIEAALDAKFERAGYSQARYGVPESVQREFAGASLQQIGEAAGMLAPPDARPGLGAGAGAGRTALGPGAGSGKAIGDGRGRAALTAGQAALPGAAAAAAAAVGKRSSSPSSSSKGKGSASAAGAAAGPGAGKLR